MPHLHKIRKYTYQIIYVRKFADRPTLIEPPQCPFCLSRRRRWLMLQSDRKIGRMTQTEQSNKVSGPTNPQPNRVRIFPEIADKGPNFETILLSLLL